MRKLGVIIAIILSSANIYGQTTIFCEVSGVIVDSLTSKPLPSALVTLISRTGSLHLSAGKDGTFSHNIPIDGDELKVEVSHLGYRIFRQYYDVDFKRHEISLGTIRLSPDPVKIDEVVVKSRMMLFENRGDTMVYFPSKLYLREGASAMDAMKHMPGVVVNASGVKVGDKYIERTYVNGRLIFGKDDPLHALNYLDATDLARVLVYDEYDENEVLLHGQNARKRRVMNLVTFEFFDKSIVAGVKTSAGYDTDKQPDGKYQERYLLGLGFKFFSEQRQLLIDYVGNNISNNSSAIQDVSRPEMSLSAVGDYTYRRSNLAFVDYSGKTAGNWDFTGKYTYYDILGRNGRVSHSDYLATSRDPARFYGDTTSQRLVTHTHKGELSFTKTGKKSMAHIRALATLTDKDDGGFSSTLVRVDDEDFSRTSVASKDLLDVTNIDVNGQFNLRTKIGSFGLSASARIGNSDLDRSQSEDSLGRLHNKLLVITGTGENQDISGSISYSIEMKNAGSVSLSYSAGYLYRREENLAIDKYTGLADPTLTRNFTDDYRSGTPGVGYRLIKGKLNLQTSLKYENKTFSRNDKFTVPASQNATFRALIPSLMVQLNLGGYNFLNLKYETSSLTPKLEMLSPHLSYTDPLYLMAGNPGLKQGYRQDLSAMIICMNTKKQSYFSTSASLSLSGNTLATKSSFFAEATPLPQYNYTATAGSVLTSFENLDGARSINGEVTYGCPIVRSKLSFLVNGSYLYDKLPMFVGEQIADRVLQTAGISTTIDSKFSKKLAFLVRYGASYSDSRLIGEQNDESLVQNAEMRVTLDFLKNAFIKTNYEYTSEYDYTSSQLLFERHNLNFTIGCRLFAKKRGEVSLSVYDIFNDNQTFTRKTYADHISSVWSYRAPRYFMLNFVYTFKNKK